MTRMWLISMMVVMLVAAATGGWWIGHRSLPMADGHALAEDGDASAAGSSSGSSAEPLAVITAVPVTVGRLQRQVIAYGTVHVPPESLRDVLVTLDGRVVSVLVVSGQQVAAGTPLVEVEPSAELLLQAEEALHQAEAAHEDVLLMEQRRALRLVTTQEAAAVRHADTLARSHHEALTRKLDPAARIVRAPVAGQVSAIAIHAGQSISNGATVATLSLSEHLEVRLGLDPSEAAMVSVGQSMRLSANEAGSKSWEAPVRSLATQVDPSMRLVDAVVPLAPDAPVRMGEVVRGTCPITIVSGLLVPRTTLRREDGATSVFTIKAGKAIRRVVTVLGENDEDAAITSEGLEAGELVANSGVRALSDGQEVTVARAEAGGEKATGDVDVVPDGARATGKTPADEKR